MQQFCAGDGVCTQQAYDDFGRPSHRWDKGVGYPDKAKARTQWLYYPWASRGQPANIVVEWNQPRCEGNFVRKLYDGFGQLIQEQRPRQGWQTTLDGCAAEETLLETVVDYGYDGLGRLLRAGVPRAVDTFAWVHASDWEAGYTATSYDAIGRPRRVTAPNGRTTDYDYHKKRVSVSMSGVGGAERMLRWQDQDALGRPVLLRAYKLASQLSPERSQWTLDAELHLSYDLADRLTQTRRRDGGSGALHTLSSMSYDLAGRKTSMVDADLGSWTYAYNKLGQLTRQTDARGQTTCLYYDGLGRLAGRRLRTDRICPGTDSPGTDSVIPRQRTLPGRLSGHYAAWDAISASGVISGNVSLHVIHNSGRITLRPGFRARASSATGSFSAAVGYDSAYHYDSKGRLQRVTNAQSERGYVYDSYSRVITETVSIDDLVRTTGYGYDSYQRPTTLTYPDGEVITTTYGSPGAPVGTSSSVHGALVDSVSMDEAGRMTAMRYPAGGNLWHTRSYYGWTVARDGGQLQSLKVGLSQGGGERFSRGYSYNGFGDIASLTEGATTRSFSYDGLGRLTNAYGRAYAYEASNRITSFAGQSYSYQDAGPYHGVDRIGGVDRYDYDANGNMTVRDKGLSSQQTLVWDAQNRLSEVRDNNGAVLERYGYDADGGRVRKTSGITTTYSFFPHYEEEVAGSATTAIRYYSFNGQRIAVKRGGTLSYLHGDHLSSSSLATDSAGAVVGGGEVRYYAYGSVRSGEVADLHTDRTFTGQKSDATGLLYYNARYYDPTLGTFISPDSMVPDPGLVIDYNRFLYARASPLRYTDPTGYDPLGPAWEEAFKKAHGGRAPTEQDKLDRLFSLTVPGSGPSGTWTDQDWRRYDAIKQEYRQSLDTAVIEEATVQLERIGGQERVVVVEAIYDFSQKVGGMHQFNKLLRGETIIRAERLPGSVEGRAERTGEISLDFRNMYNNFLEQKAVVVHELAHVIDYRSGLGPFFKYSSRIPKVGRRVPVTLWNGLSGREEHFASIVTTWVYEGIEISSGVYNDYIVTPKQAQWLARKLGQQ